MTGGSMFENMGYFLIFLLAVAVFLFIVAIIFLVVQKRSKDKARKIPASQRSPPYEYMRNVGINCPDYWQYMGEDPNQEGHHLCKNVNNIKVHDDEQLVERITSVKVRHNQIVQHRRMFVVRIGRQLPQCLDFSQYLP